MECPPVASLLICQLAQSEGRRANGGELGSSNLSRESSAVSAKACTELNAGHP